MWYEESTPQGYVTHNFIEHTYAKILISALEAQVSWGETHGDVVNY